MKIAPIILSMLILTSSIFSFGDEFLLNSNEIISDTHIIEGTTTHENHHNDTDAHKVEHQEDEHSNSGCEDECHFCVCTCSAHNIVPPLFKIDIISLESINSSIISNYTFSYSSGYLSTIFQPPQV